MFNIQNAGYEVLHFRGADVHVHYDCKEVHSSHVDPPRH